MRSAVKAHNNIFLNCRCTTFTMKKVFWFIHVFYLIKVPTKLFFSLMIRGEGPAAVKSENGYLPMNTGINTGQWNFTMSVYSGEKVRRMQLTESLGHWDERIRGRLDVNKKKTLKHDGWVLKHKHLTFKENNYVAQLPLKPDHQKFQTNAFFKT